MHGGGQIDTTRTEDHKVAHDAPIQRVRGGCAAATEYSVHIWRLHVALQSIGVVHDHVWVESNDPIVPPPYAKHVRVVHGSGGRPLPSSPRKQPLDARRDERF
eukprot:scaffold90054_cov75-Phaeocystis_antarctica.AAC.12